MAEAYCVKDKMKVEVQNPVQITMKNGKPALSGTCPAVSFIVSGVTVTTSATTRFEDGACSGLRNGARVEVQGTRSGDTVMASEVDFD